MTQDDTMRQTAWKIINGALQAVDPAAAVHNYFDAQPDIAAQIQNTPGRVFVVGAGKAGSPMALAISERFGDKLSDGLVIVKYDHLGEKVPVGISLKEAGHPVPDEAGLQAAQEIAALLNQAGPDDTVLCLISGGGSALLSLPVEGITLADLQDTTSSLLAAGSIINEVNTIRKHLSAIKGGGLARMAAPARVFTLILSDVVGDPLEVIASGPTVPDPTTFADSWAIVKRYQLENKLPQPVLDRLTAGLNGHIPDTPKPDNPLFLQVHNAVIGSNRIAAQAAVDAAQAAGYSSQLLSTFVEGEAREVARVVAGLAKGLARDESTLARPACMVLGGETTVTIRGKGKGGRNQEMALAAALALAGWSNILVVCLGTDGTDGPTDAAGGFADGTTVARAKALNLNPIEYLQNNDAYNLLAALDDLIITGPTNTNVNDLILILVQ